MRPHTPGAVSPGSTQPGRAEGPTPDPPSDSTYLLTPTGIPLALAVSPQQRRESPLPRSPGLTPHHPQSASSSPDRRLRPPRLSPSPPCSGTHPLTHTHCRWAKCSQGRRDTQLHRPRSPVLPWTADSPHFTGAVADGRPPPQPSPGLAPPFPPFSPQNFQKYETDPQKHLRGGNCAEPHGCTA